MDFFVPFVCGFVDFCGFIHFLNFRFFCDWFGSNGNGK